MKFGLAMFPTDYSVDPAELARMVEERGFESLFFPEHTHIPVEPRHAVPGRAASCRGEYCRTLDPFVALHGRRGGHRAPAGRHRHLPGRRARPDHHREGGRHVDRLSGGRFLFGVGRGLERGGDGEPRHRPVEALRR